MFPQLPHHSAFSLGRLIATLLLREPYDYPDSIPLPAHTRPDHPVVLRHLVCRECHQSFRYATAIVADVNRVERDYRHGVMDRHACLVARSDDAGSLAGVSVVSHAVLRFEFFRTGEGRGVHRGVSAEL